MQAETLLLGRGMTLERVSADTWQKSLLAAPLTAASRLAFMTDEHQAVRESAVLHLPRNGGHSLSPRQLSRLASVPVARIGGILNDLHRNLFFLVRNRRGNVSWAFPVTVDRTPHALSFSSGERIWAA